ncbi:MAG: diguanylate cyclase [Hahellaceae bacterium]|nr:diguanylate cyclase [Hahellaceae bacterium]MCP5168813.1 diguanylate cyclase [Hahellaceae bacterium]
MKVLLVDDSPVDRVIAEAFLLELGHEVILGENGRQAIDLYQQHKPDLVLMDEVMPEVRGYEAAQIIRQMDGDSWVPIIFLSARFSADDIAAGIDAGGDDYLAKPIDQKVLAAKVKAMSRIAMMRSQLLDVSSRLEVANAELRRLVDVDGLTGLANRRLLDQRLPYELARCSRSQESLAVIMCDIDEFKKYNDRYGHLKGDDCLKMVASVLQDETRRATDLVARFGGEEFCIVMPGSLEGDAQDRAEAILACIRKLALPHAASATASVVTLSMGLYCCVPTQGVTATYVIACADKALYKAKQEGRNRLVTYTSDISASGRVSR